MGWENLVDIPFKCRSDVVGEGDAWPKAPSSIASMHWRLTPTRAARSLLCRVRLGRRQCEVAARSNSDQGRRCCRCPSRLVSEESSESCLLLLLMGKKAAEPFKEKSFMAARVFSVGSARFGRHRWFESSVLVRKASAAA
jgi:hypothetical protein